MVVMAQAGEGLEVMSNNSFEEIQIENGSPSGWIRNPAYKQAGAMSVITEGAKDGKNCIEITTGPELLYALCHKEPISVLPGDKIRLNVFVKGVGRFRLDLYLFCKSSSGGSNWWGRNIQDQQVFDVDSGEWTCRSVEIEVPGGENGEGVTINGVKPALFVFSNSTLQFDCFTGSICK